jgi:HSP20 family protein
MENGIKLATQESTDPQTATARARETLTLTPLVDIFEDPTGITLLADMPGVAKNSLNVRVEADRLFLEGKADVEVPEGFSLYHSEVSESVYRRSFVLGPALDTANIDANLKDGVLTLRIPRSQEARPRHIEIKSA